MGMQNFLRSKDLYIQTKVKQHDDFRRHCLGNCRTKYLNNRNSNIWYLIAYNIILAGINAKNYPVK